MIKNETKHINANEIENITSKAKENNFYLVILDGREIHNEQEYINAMKRVNFHFPYGSWVIDGEEYKGFVLIIDYYNSFLANEPYNENCLQDGRNVTFKQYLEIEGFNDITNYWENEIIALVSGGGTPRSFNIYLVDR